MESDLGKLFIGGISWDTDEERLREYFTNYGEVVEAVIMRDRATGRARGFGFIVFADHSVAERVILEKHIIDGRTVEAKKAVPRDDHQQVLKRHATPMHLMSPGGNRTKKIFVGGLPSSITEAEFKNYFDQFGTVCDVVVMYDHNTQRPRGFGFITFDSDDAVDRVLHKTFHELNGKLVEVKRAVPKEVSLVSNIRSPLHGAASGGGGYGGGGANRMTVNNSYFNNFAPGPPGGYYNNLGGGGSVLGGRFSPVIGSGRLNLNLNPSYDGTDSSAFAFNRFPNNPYFNGPSPNRYTSPIGQNRTESLYSSSSNIDLWGNRSDPAGPGWNLNVSNGNNRGNWGLPSSAVVGNDDNGYGGNFRTGSGLSGSPFEGSSIGGLYRGGSVYSDSTWQLQQQQLLPQSSQELDAFSYGYDIDNVGSDPNDSEGYNVGNRQTNRGIEA
ncbi:heterogeneous nuclear ribonucleoprotein 1 [Raphanus sativus]|uniref:Heterogeneous nuclear ribonucleoprotein 1 n=1 Tax=Raphanus sativus TaxID=3726 RepID=A0A6J0MKF2_RAPSA|nr:heterogeneous nuclear ribonucleoprotein 1 [Raphanus sativus]